MANAGNRKSVQSAAAREKARIRQEREDLIALMSTPAGRRVVWRFLTQCNPLGSAFNSNAMTQSHTIGWQDAGKWWLLQLEAACPEKYTQMAAEARKAAKEAELQAQLDEEDEHDD